MSRDSVESIVAERRARGVGRLDECWEGVWHLTDPTGPHQDMAGRIYAIHAEVLGHTRTKCVWISINVTDREDEWMENHRCPDGAVILPGNPGRWIGKKHVAFLGGPDLIVEVLSEDDDTYLKLPFYEALRVREVLIVDPETGRPELWRLEAGGFAKVVDPQLSVVTDLVYSEVSAGLVVTDPKSGRAWRV